MPLRQMDILPHPNVTAVLCGPSDRWRKLEGDLTVGSLTFTPVPLSHDAPGGTVAWTVQRIDTNETLLFYATVQDAMNAAAFSAFETNHSVSWLRRSGRPERLIERIVGPRGHLSNVQAGRAIRRRLENGSPLKGFMALHLSQDANAPGLVDSMLRGLFRSQSLSYWIASRVAPTPPLWITPNSVLQGPLIESRTSTRGALPLFQADTLTARP
jgi:hypothetical protein